MKSKNNLETYVERLDYLIKLKNIVSLNELSDFVNIPISTLSRMKSGKTQPSIESLISISNKFNVTLDWLIKGKENKGGKKKINPLLKNDIISVPLIEDNKLKSKLLDFNREKEVKKIITIPYTSKNQSENYYAFRNIDYSMIPDIEEGAILITYEIDKSKWSRKELFESNKYYVIISDNKKYIRSIQYHKEEGKLILKSNIKAFKDITLNMDDIDSIYCVLEKRLKL